MQVKTYFFLPLSFLLSKTNERYICPRTMSSSHTALEHARQLPLPTREEILRRDPSISFFWNRYRSVLEKAWGEWAESEEQKDLPVLDETLIHPDLRYAINEAWKNPTKEYLVRDLWKEVAPGVYQCPFLDPTRIRDLRSYFDRATNAGIPTRAPFGIVLNRNGFMLDPRSEGYLATRAFQEFYRKILIDTYMRPLGRLFFPDYIQADDDSQSFGFSIQYQAGKDQSIREHCDASSLTLNINLNLPNGQEQYEGSSLYFKDQMSGTKTSVKFSPGYAVIHRGAVPHAALPIANGQRSNLVLWLFGRQGWSSHIPYSKEEQMSRMERWTKPTGAMLEQDDYAPF